MSLELNEVERVALVELRTEAIEGTNCELVPRSRQFTSILRKLAGTESPNSECD